MKGEKLFWNWNCREKLVKLLFFIILVTRDKSTTPQTVQGKIKMLFHYVPQILNNEVSRGNQLTLMKLASFPGLPWLQFLIAVCKNRVFLHIASDKKLEPWVSCIMWLQNKKNWEGARKARLNSTRVRAKSGETPENKTNGISTYNELVDQWSLFQSNKHLYVACSNICTLVCRLLKHLRPGSRFLIGKKCAWSLDHLFKSSWSLHFFFTGQRSNWNRAFLILWFS